MKTILTLLWLHSMTLLLYANEYAVVTRTELGKITKTQMKAIYLKKLHYLKGKKLLPINLEADNSIRKSFNKHILHMNYNRLKIYWMKQHYLGHRPPLSLHSQKSVKAFLNKVDGAIGYVEMKNIEKNMHILLRWSD
ncbi:hypothetical protein [Sulfurimonas sp.]|uniref:hypothetical protein n=1 Tax=Sulfurimonas sp. TaxID=2022749 RepID=UPI002628717D|nr:hypothetical protein [Sulfurimonas sp.]